MWLDKMAAVYVLIRSTVVALLCVQTTKAQHVHVVAKLWADGSRIPHGYVVPVGGDVTFTCRHNDSLTRSLFWEIVIVNGTVTTPTTALFLSNEPGLSSPATGNTDNPVNLTVHNLQLGNNGSTVRCSVEVEGSPAFILVEGVPSCPVLNLSSLTAEVSSLSVTWTAVEHTLLPIWYQVMVSASDNYTWSQETTTNHVNISTSRPLASTAYNISVTTCNEAGCNEGCPVYTTNETATEDTVYYLSPAGEVQVCMCRLASCSGIYTSTTLLLSCSARDLAFWSTAGFGKGLDDQTRVTGVRLASSSTRVTTYDYRARAYSYIRISGLTYDDHGATVTCEDAHLTGQRSVKISVGPPNCTMSLTASRVTADSAVISWDIHTCLGALPTDYKLTWYPVGEAVSTVEETNMTTSISSSNNSQYEITGLKPNTRYLIVLYLSDMCGDGNGYTALAETASANIDPTMIGLVAVIVILLPVLLTLIIVLVIFCIKSRLSAVDGEGSEEGGGLELREEDEYPCKETKPTGGEIKMDENPSYETIEI